MFGAIRWTHPIKPQPARCWTCLPPGSVGSKPALVRGRLRRAGGRWAACAPGRLLALPRVAAPFLRAGGHDRPDFRGGGSQGDR